MYEIHTVPFYENDLITAEVDREHYVAMKPIVKGMGLAWQTQQRKITSSQRYHHMVIPLQTTGGIQEMLCLPIKKLNGWLFSINPEKVKPELQDSVIKYQEECFMVLYEYWHHGETVNPRFHRENHTFPTTSSLRERLALMEMKRKLSVSLQRVSYYEQTSIRRSLNEISRRLGEKPMYPFEEESHHNDLDISPDGCVPF